MGKIQKVRNIGLYKNLEALRSTPAKAMEYDTEALLVNTQIVRIRDRFAAWHSLIISTLRLLLS